MKKTGLRIRIYGDELLRRKAKSVPRVTSEHRRILSEMAQLMYGSSGIGLAAPQVGISESLIVVDAGSGLYKLINPRIVKKKGWQSLEEGCLSVPGVCIKVKRAKKVVIKARNEEAKPLEITAEGLLACVFQHEIDHLSGRLIVDYASFLERLKIKRKIEEFKRSSADEELFESERKSCKLQL